jgi:glycerophosphoryl diester phosphodiesterase
MSNDSPFLLQIRKEQEEINQLLRSENFEDREKGQRMLDEKQGKSFTDSELFEALKDINKRSKIKVSDRIRWNEIILENIEKTGNNLQEKQMLINEINMLKAQKKAEEEFKKLIRKQNKEKENKRKADLIYETEQRMKEENNYERDQIKSILDENPFNEPYEYNSDDDRNMLQSLDIDTIKSKKKSKMKPRSKESDLNNLFNEPYNSDDDRNMLQSLDIDTIQSKKQRSHMKPRSDELTTVIDIDTDDEDDFDLSFLDQDDNDGKLFIGGKCKTRRRKCKSKTRRRKCKSKSKSRRRRNCKSKSKISR